MDNKEYILVPKMEVLDINFQSYFTTKYNFFRIQWTITYGNCGLDTIKIVFVQDHSATWD